MAPPVRKPALISISFMGIWNVPTPLVSERVDHRRLHDWISSTALRSAQARLDGLRQYDEADIALPGRPLSCA